MARKTSSRWEPVVSWGMVCRVSMNWFTVTVVCKDEMNVNVNVDEDEDRTLAKSLHASTRTSGRSACTRSRA